MTAPALEMAGISKRYPGVVALDNVTLTAAPGEVVALLGENGAGKSTLMKVLGGVVIPDAGAVKRDGQPVAPRNPADAARNGIAFVHQELSVLDNLDIAGNVYLGREPRKGVLLDREAMREGARTAIARIGLDLSPDTPVHQLSIAQQQMVEIARALAQDARVLILDEPTSSLTPSETERLLSVVDELRKQGVTILYITHRLGEVVAIADRAVVLRDGKNVGEISRAELTHDKMVSMMVGRDIQRGEGGSGAEPGAVRLSLQGVRTARYPEQPVSFDVRAGEIVGIAGLVGAGRTELAQALFGVIPAVGGQIALDGAPVKVARPHDAISRGLYLIPEDRRGAGLIVSLPIRENISMPSLTRYVKGLTIDKRAEAEAAEEGCRTLTVKTHSVENAAANLSGGNQQKVVLARWLLRDPKVLIFDEPTRGIDVGAKAEIYSLMRDLAQRGVAILMISSDMEEILALSDRVAVLRQGALSGILSRNEASEESILSLAVHHDQ